MYTKYVIRHNGGYYFTGIIGENPKNWFGSKSVDLAMRFEEYSQANNFISVYMGDSIPRSSLIIETV